MKKEIEQLRRITTNLYNVKIQSVEETKIAGKFVTIKKYNSSICSVYCIEKPISKIIDKID